MLASRRQAGDTIIEVLLCIAVVSTVLGGAYVTVRRGLDNSRQAQERSEGLKHVETQLEQLRIAVETNPSVVFAGTTATNDFCLDSSNTPIIARSAPPPQAPPLDSDNFDAYVPACKFAGAGDGYNMSITRSGNDFIARTRWNREGGGRDEVQIRYRLLPP